MNPVLHVQSPDYFKKKQEELNRVLAFEGLRLTDQGTLESCKQARTITEAEALADQLRRKLIERRVHSDVLKFCRAELVEGNYFHAVLEATKSVAQKIRDKTGLSSDGGELVDDAFGIGKKACPVLAFNALSTESEQSEHKGLMNLMKGFFGTFRNPTAHAPRIAWEITEQDALDMMTVASLLHRRLDEAVKTGF
ncbi:MAG: TIGR02391 family protein [Candidatus Latescibacterota bacterium]